MDYSEAKNKTLYLQLCQESRILHLVYHRNKNQHRSTHWWKRLNMLKRNCSRVVSLLARKDVTGSRDLAKLYHLLHGFRQKQVSKIYYDFNSVIGLGQFVSLGVVLVGILSRIFVIYGKLLDLYDEQFQNVGFFRIRETMNAKQEEQLMENMVAEELGAEIKQISDPKQSQAGVKFEPPVQKSPKLRSSKKKKKSAIDSIFG